MADRITRECDEAAKLWITTISLYDPPPQNPSNVEYKEWERGRDDRLARWKAQRIERRTRQCINERTSAFMRGGR